MKPARKLLRFLKRIFDKIFGSFADEFYWRIRSKKWALALLNPDSLNHPHRAFLIGEFEKYEPFENVLEIGCGSGPNLYLLSRRLPNAKICGADINKKALRVGAQWFLEKKIRNVKFVYGKPYDLGQFKDGEMDIVFTDAAMLYIGPDKIGSAICELLRVAKKALIFNEMHTANTTPIRADHWIYNWPRLLEKYPDITVTLKKIPPELWGGDWAKFGYVIEATKKN